MLAWHGKATVVGLLVLVQAAWGWMDLSGQAHRIKYSKETLATITVAVERQAQEGDVIVTNPAIAQQLEYVRKWKVVEQNVYQGNGPAMGPNPMAQGGVDEL